MNSTTIDELDEFDSRSSLFGHNPRILSHEARLGLCGRENTMPSRRYTVHYLNQIKL
jgi:hypothetical protein